MFYEDILINNGKLDIQKYEIHRFYIHCPSFLEVAIIADKLTELYKDACLYLDIYIRLYNKLNNLCLC